MTQPEVTLGQLVSDGQVFYQKLRAWHWTVKGPDFFDLHEKFEELYTEWATHVDDLAERMLGRGMTPPLTYAAALEHSALKEVSGSAEARPMVEHCVTDLDTIIGRLGSAIAHYEEKNDRRTVNLLDDIRDAQTKHIWMLKSWLGR